jgi:hypothetical protein
MSPFLTNAEFLARHDGRWIGKNLLDDGTAPTIAQMSDPSTVSGIRLETLITDASEELMSAAAVGARYTEDDLRTYGGNLVKSITAGLAIGPILERRGRAVEDWDKMSAAYNRAAKRVEELRRGERIFFAVPDVPEAGLPESASMSPRAGIDPPAISTQASRYFGNPASYPGQVNGVPPGGGW